MELAAALAVLLVVALIAGPGNGHRRPAPQQGWVTGASAAATVLIGDLTALERDAAAGAGQPAGAWEAALRADNGRLATDLAAARSLDGGPPSSLSTRWSAALAHVGEVVQAAEREVGDAEGTTSRLQADTQSLDAASTAAGDSLLRLAALLGS